MVYSTIFHRIISRVVLVFIVLIVTLLATYVYSSKAVTSQPCNVVGSDSHLILQASDFFLKSKISGAFLASKDGRVVAQGYCGTSDPVHRAPITPGTLFNIGSLTKQFTGYVLLDLAREGKLNLEDPLSRYFPAIANRPMGKVTLRQLEQMRGGIPYILPKKDFLGVQFSKRIHSSQEMLETITSLDPIAQPGERFEYSNLGYSLLGLVIAQVDGGSWANSLKKRIFDPFGMRYTTTEGEVSDPPNHLATGLLPIESPFGTWFITLPHWNYSMVKGAGGIVSNVEELHRWNEALTKKARVEPDWAKEYFPSGQAGEESYSFGWFLSESTLSDGRIARTINHGGEDPGYCAQNTRFESADTHLVFTTNSDYCALKEGAYREFTRAMLTELAVYSGTR